MENEIYLRANRTIETLLINEQQTLFLYNHQGQYYKVFNQREELDKYLNALPYQMVGEFYSEEGVDGFLRTYDCRTYDVGQLTPKS